MKKLLLLAAFAVFALTTTNAQDEDSMGFAQSDLYVSGTLGFASISGGDADGTAYNFSPSVGYFLTDNIALEGSLSYGNAGGDNSSSFGIGAGARYFLAPASQFSLTLGAGLNYNSQESGEDSKLNTFTIAVAPGVNYFVSDAFALRASFGSLGYTTAKADVDGAPSVSQFGLNIDLSNINFGMTYKF